MCTDKTDCNVTCVDSLIMCLQKKKKKAGAWRKASALRDRLSELDTSEEDGVAKKVKDRGEKDKER